MLKANYFLVKCIQMGRIQVESGENWMEKLKPPISLENCKEFQRI